jgi:hypothetical protein
MNNTPTSTNKGLVKIILLIVIALLILSYFGFNLRALISSPTTQDNFGYVASSSVTVWDKYLKKPASYVWNDIFIDLIWEPAIDNLKRINSGEKDDIQLSQPTVPTPSLN